MPDLALPDKRVFQICVIVDDIERVAENYRAILGFDVPTDHQITRAHDHTRATYHGQPMNARAKITSFMMDGVAFELLQPLEAPSVWMDHLKARGPSLHHIAFDVPRVAPAAAHFADHGYEVTQQGLFTGRTGMYVYLDTDRDLGVTMELLEHYRRGPQRAAPPFPAGRGLGTNRVVQVGILTEDIAAMTRRYQDVLDLPEPQRQQTPGHDVTEAAYRGEPTGATAKLAFFDFGQVQLELIEPDRRPSVWRHDLDARGDGAHHIAFRVEDTGRAVEHLAAHGLRVVQQGYYGDRGGMYTYVDSAPALGVTVELLENFERPR